MAKAFPKLRFHLWYAEIGVEFCGEMIALKGKYCPEICYMYVMFLFEKKKK